MNIDTHDREISDGIQYFITLDFETTGWDQNRRIGRFLSPPEIIEISAAVVNGSGGVIGRFQQYVLPTEFPTLTENCMWKTDVTQEDVDAGLPLADALDRFNNWIDMMLLVGSFIMKPVDSDLELDIPLGAFVTWTDWPLRVCLENECLRKGLVKPDIFNYWIDLKLVYRRRYPQENSYTFKNILLQRGLDSKDPDIRFTNATTFGWLIDKMIKDGVAFRLTSSFKEKDSVINSSRGEEDEPEEGQSLGVSNESEE